MVQIIDLNGTWHYSGKEEGNIEIPCAIEQRAQERDYDGLYHFQRTFIIDEKKENCHYIVEFDGVSYWCRISCNGTVIREHEGIWDSFQADITEALRTGENEIEVKVRKPDFQKDSPYYFRSVLFGFIPDVMLPFGGIWRDVRLKIVGEVYFTRMVPRFHAEEKELVLQTGVYGAEQVMDGSLTVRTEVHGPDGSTEVFEQTLRPEVSCRFREISLWRPSAPAVYRGKVCLCRNGVCQDEAAFSGGFRTICADGGTFRISGEPFYMRGILHWGCYPDRMSPSPTREEVKDELQKIRAMGFNTVKHCLYFPPKYYYELCDEMGIVTWQELPLWLPYRNAYLRERIHRQYPRMLDHFLTYPTVLLASLGCELDATIDSGMLDELYRLLKGRASEVLVCDNSGSGECFEGVTDSKSDIYDYHFYAELYELNTLIREFTAGYRQTKPWVFGEFGDSDTFRLVEENIGKWWLSPDERVNPLRKVHKGFGSDQPVYRQREILEEYGVTGETEGLNELSVRQMLEIRKFILETTRSFPDVSGYNITTIRDVPITTAGLFDDEMEGKADPAFMQRINGEVAVSFQKDLARQWKNGSDHFLNKDRYHYFSGEHLKGRFVISNRSQDTLEGTCRISLEDEEGTCCVWEETFCAAGGATAELARPDLRIPCVEHAVCLTLKAELQWCGGRYENSWPVWAYPKDLTDRPVYVLDPAGGLAGIEEQFKVLRLGGYEELCRVQKGDILVAAVCGRAVEDAAGRGAGVILFVSDDTCYPVVKVPFFREGVVKIKEHPAMKQTAHRGFAGIQYFGVAPECAIDKAELEAREGSYQSLIRRFDARKFFVCEYAAELIRGEGRMIISTLDVGGGKGEQPDGLSENRFGTYLLSEWIKYLDNGAAYEE